MNYKVLITTSGIGGRLGEITDYTNKCLVRVGKKPAISYIIESYPECTDFVITVGHYGDQVIDYINIAYPDLNVEFVNIDNYHGDGSSLLYSMLQAKDSLKCPFVFNACDTILVDEQIPIPDHNWVGGNQAKSSTEYRSLKTNGIYLEKINQKGELNYDLIHIGLIGVFDYNEFYQELEKIYEEDKLNRQLSDCDVINSLLNNGVTFNVHETKSWIDIGNIDRLKEARANIYDKFQLLDKVDESTFIVGEDVIKFFYDKKTNKKRVDRVSKFPPNTVPGILDFKENFYKYQYIDGEPFSNTINENSFKDFLGWSRKKLWNKIDTNSNFKTICEDFYFHKTKKRINDFLEKHNLKDEQNVINGIEVPSISDLINRMDFNLFNDMSPCLFHGDFILDNIIDVGNKDFRLIDWRQDFGGQIEFGDIYYDLSKLNHSLILSHKIINDHGYKIVTNDDLSICCDILLSNNLISCQKILFKFIEDNGFDIKKVKLLTPIIWINMSPLHEYPLDKFLFYFGKFNLMKEIVNED